MTDISRAHASAWDAIIKQFDSVELLIDLPEQGLKAGDSGAVVDVYGDGEGFTVEFFDAEGNTTAVATLGAGVLRLKGKGDDDA